MLLMTEGAELRRRGDVVAAVPSDIEKRIPHGHIVIPPDQKQELHELLVKLQEFEHKLTEQEEKAQAEAEAEAKAAVKTKAEKEEAISEVNKKDHKAEKASHTGVQASSLKEEAISEVNKKDHKAEKASHTGIQASSLVHHDDNEDVKDLVAKKANAEDLNRSDDDENDLPDEAEEIETPLKAEEDELKEAVKGGKWDELKEAIQGNKWDKLKEAIDNSKKTLSDILSSRMTAARNALKKLDALQTEIEKEIDDMKRP